MSNGLGHEVVQFLTLEEAQVIDAAQLSTLEKFMTRITVSSLRVLQKIATDLGVTIAALEPARIVAWIEADAQIRRDRGIEAAFLKWPEGDDLEFPDPLVDEVSHAKLSSHEKFLARLTIAALKVLAPMAEDCGVGIETLAVSQIVAWVQEHGTFEMP